MDFISSNSIENGTQSKQLNINKTTSITDNPKIEKNADSISIKPSTQSIINSSYNKSFHITEKIQYFFENSISLKESSFIEEFDKNVLRFISVNMIERPHRRVIDVYDVLYSEIYKYPLKNVNEYEPKTAMTAMISKSKECIIDDMNSMLKISSEKELSEYLNSYTPYTPYTSYTTLSLNNVMLNHQSVIDKSNMLYMNALKYETDNSSNHTNISHFNYTNSGTFEIQNKIGNMSEIKKCELNVGKIWPTEISLYNVDRNIVNTLLKDNYVFYGFINLEFHIFMKFIEISKYDDKEGITEFIVFLKYVVDRYVYRISFRKDEKWIKRIETISEYYGLSIQGTISLLRLLIYVPDMSVLHNKIKELKPSYEIPNKEHSVVANAIYDIQQIYEKMYNTDIGEKLNIFFKYTLQKLNIPEFGILSYFACYLLQYYETTILQLLFNVLLKENIIEQKLYKVFKKKRICQSAYDCVLLQNGFAIRKDKEEELVDISEKINNKIFAITQININPSLLEFGSKKLPILKINEDEFKSYIERVQSRNIGIMDYNKHAVVPIEKLTGENVAMIIYELFKNSLYYCKKSNRVYLKEGNVYIKNSETIKSIIMNKISNEYKYCFGIIDINERYCKLEMKNYFEENDFLRVWKYLMKHTSSFIPFVNDNIVQKILLKDEYLSIYNDKIVVEPIQSVYKYANVINLYIHRLDLLIKNDAFMMLKDAIYSKIKEEINTINYDTNTIIEWLNKYNTLIEKYCILYIIIYEVIVPSLNK